ncbi:ATP-dependent Clp protease adapter ClpS [Uruburuella testudinis]|uniref:ATP-dependent Clp protease adapter protein ClpS n=1 Tax=Uruburuella testudinis TaxID=1282863 RepID=A0ABY4DR05_9NEIS|nr:ATP-dependent Clp protease adapter ClpS [Uruburuella testudinis]UOO81164.1 ATP-dependent Clp protease adapter ClpS [Uruburuella testudinis]
MSNVNASRETGAAALSRREKIAPPKKYGVYLLNDDYTPMDFVVNVLTEIFVLPQARAMAVMLLVHHEGKGLCGVYTLDMAQTKQQQVMRRAKREGHPLQCTVEEV